MKTLQYVSLLLLLSVLVLSACGPAPVYEVGSELVCPKNYDPATSVCTVKKTAEEVVDLNESQVLKAVRLGVDEVGVYRRDGETYGVYERVGFHPTPEGYVRIYPKNQQMVVSDIDPAACGGYNETTCVNALSNVTLMGFQKFDSSYNLKLTINFGSQENLKSLYEVTSFRQLMVEFNNHSRDAFRDSKDIDPRKYISGEIDKPWVAKNWKEKLSSSPYMTDWQYNKLITVTELSVRYFEPAKSGEGEQVQSSQVLEDQEYADFLAKKELFCAQYTPGTHLRAECDRTFVCSQGNVTCYFGSSIIPGEQLTPTAVNEIETTTP